MVHVRRLGASDVDAIAELTGHAFGGADPAAAAALQKFANQACPFMPPDLCWGVEENGRLLAKWQLLDLTASIGEARLRVAGAHAVAVHRDHHGQHLIEELFRRARHEVEELGFEIILGFAQRGALYHLLGAVPVCAEYEWSCDALKLPQASREGFREQAEPRELVRLYNLAQGGRPLSLLRSAELWPWLLRKPSQFLLGPGGYLGLRQHADALEVRELGFEHAGFAEHALRLLSTLAREHGIRRIHGHLPMDHPLVQASLPFGAEVSVRYEKRAGAMGGVVHIGRFLDRIQLELERRWSLSAHAGFTLALELQLEDRSHTLELGAGAGRARKLRLALSSSALLQLVLGYLRPAALLNALAYEGPFQERARSLLSDRDALSLLEALFPAAHPFVSHTDRW
jgi:hypothetical protein